jgi:hypothetical protein
MGLVPVRELICAKQLRWFGHIVRMENTRAPKQLLTCWIDHKRELGRPCQMFGHSLKKFLRMRANLNDCDLNRTFNYTVKQPRQDNGEAGAETTTILDAEKFSKILLTTSGSVADDQLTCMDLPLDRVLWKKIVNNNYAQPKHANRGRYVERDFSAHDTSDDTSNNNYGTSQVDISAYDSIHQNLPCPHYDSQRIYGVYGYNKDTQNMSVSTTLYSAWSQVIREAMAIEKRIQVRPIILMNYTTFMNRKVMTDKLAILKSKEIQMQATQHAKQQAALQAFTQQAEQESAEEQRQAEQEQKTETERREANETKRSRRLQERKENN